MTRRRCCCANSLGCSPCAIPLNDLTASWSGAPGGSAVLAWNGGTTQATAVWSASGVTINGITGVSIRVVCTGGTILWTFNVSGQDCPPNFTSYTCSPFHITATAAGRPEGACLALSGRLVNPLSLDG